MVWKIGIGAITILLPTRDDGKCAGDNPSAPVAPMAIGASIGEMTSAKEDQVQQIRDDQVSPV